MKEPLIAPSKKILRHPSILERMKADNRIAPVNVEFDLSDACNLKCKWCAFVHLRKPVFMSYELANSILAQLALAGVKAITFSGGGEPTLNAELPRIATRAADLGLTLGIYTNGLMIDYLLPAAHLFAWIYISVDAHDVGSYRHGKGVDGFDRVLNNAMLLRTKAKVLGLGFLLDGDNWHFASLMASLRFAVNADYAQFRPVVGLPDYRWVVAALGRLRELEADETIYIGRQRFLDLLQKRRPEYEICRGSELVPCVGADGTLWVCPNMRGLRALGDLKSETFEEIWKRRPVQEVGDDCRIACRNHFLNQTLDYVCGQGPHDAFV